MAAPSTIQELLGLLRQSQLIPDQALAPFLPQAQSVAAAPDGPSQFVKFLVSKGLLTAFQAEQVMQGKWRGFFIGRYKVMQPVGSGGMANVFLCEHKFMKRQVALKVLPASKAKDSSFVERFYREARAAAALDHPNIVRAYDVSQENNLHFLVMEYVDGATLHDLVKKGGPLSPAQTIDYIGQAAAGLQHAYESGLIHRDIKPSNLVIDRSGTLKVLDMGLARFFHDEDDNLTRKYDETVLGTADYLAPEQAMDSHTVDIRADIYSLGATFYYALTGKAPFSEGTVAQKLLWHQNKAPRPIRETRADVPSDLVALIDKMMAKDPARRFHTPAELARAAGALSSANSETVKSDTFVSGSVRTLQEMKLGEAATASAKRISRVLPKIKAIKLPGFAALPRRWRLWAGIGVAALLLLFFVLWLSLRGGHAPTGGGKKRSTAAEKVKPPTDAKPVFLADLPERDVVVHNGVRFGKKDDLGHNNSKIVVRGVVAANGLSMHPSPNSAAKVAYILGRKYRVFKAAAALNDSSPGSATPLTFLVKGDGKILWKSRPIQKTGQSENCVIPIEGVDRLELEVDCPGPYEQAHAVWIDPQVLP